MPSEIGAALVALLPRLRRYALSLTRATEAADDLVQSACERALATDSTPGDAPFDAWMFRILRNLWFDRLRRLRSEGVQVDIEEQFDLQGAAGMDEAESRMTLARVREAIEQLPDEQREVLMLVCVEELSYADAAQVLDVPIGTVMSRLSRARARLARLSGLSGGQP
jgi:RNA polymerase sigma-70 factor (ECF subfamily)